MHLFSYPTDLHYSQTKHWVFVMLFRFSYHTDSHYSQTSVLPVAALILFSYPTDLHYSQTDMRRRSNGGCLVTLQIYTTLKHVAEIFGFISSLVTLQIYTTLKPFPRWNNHS